MENFLSNFWGEDSLIFMFSALVSFLIGFITAWLMWGGKAKRYQREAEKWKKNHDDLQLKFNNLKGELDLKEADLVKAQREAHEAIQLAKSIEAEKDKWQADLNAAIEDSVKAQATASSYQATIEDLNNQIIGLKSLNAELTEAVGSGGGSQAQTAPEPSRLEALEEKISKLEAEHSSILMGSSPDATSRLEALEAKMAEMEAENNALKTQLESAASVNENEGGDAPNEEEIFAPAPDMAEVDKGETLTLGAVAARDDVTAALGDKIPAATEADKDDLTRIKGIGTFLEKKLNGLGIYTYEQVSLLDAELIGKVTAAIEFFPGRIERDDWVGQAARLMDIKEDAPEALSPSAVFSTKSDDLKTVEGIGPKIEKLLKDNGIPDLNALSEATEKRLREILFAAGSRYRIHDPSSWPGQAALATNGKWEELKELQDRLIGGRDVSG
ncbi:MAG TPA: hypothetical protein ENJ95_08235 [Bacteroidetes bacterium]|nr:hypothetical protein [Bacteroidota bacterium]